LATALAHAADPSPRLAARSTDQRIAAIQVQLKHAPESTTLRDELAGAYLQKMRETADGSYLERAGQLVTQILKTEPANYEARRRLVEIEMHRHRFQQVVSLAGVLSVERPADTIVWGLLGDAWMELGDYDRAADVYQRMVDLRPNLASYNRVAFYRFVTGDPEGAIAAMRLAIRAGSSESENVAWCLVELGRMLFTTGATEEAERVFRDALATYPGYHYALAGLGRVQIERGQYDDAIRSLLAAQRQAPFPEYTKLLAKLYRKTGKEVLAEKQIALLDVVDQLGKAAGENTNRHLALALADLNHRTARAVELARAEMEVRHDVYSCDALAWALFLNGDAPAAYPLIERALSKSTPEPLFHFHAARILEALGRSDEARHHRDQATASITAVELM
jgi:tetratricopeptide (TPR) repeat protein